MIRLLYRILAILSLLACFVSGIFWIRGYWVDEMWMKTWSPKTSPGSSGPDGFFPPSTTSRDLVIYSNYGSLRVGSFLCDFYTPRWMHKSAEGSPHNSPFFESEGFHRSKRGVIPYFAITMSYSISTFAFAILPICLIITNRLKRHRRGFPVETINIRTA